MMEIRESHSEDDEHEGKKNVTKRVTKVFQIQHPSFNYNRAFYRKWRMEISARHRVVSVDSDLPAKRRPLRLL